MRFPDDVARTLVSAIFSPEVGSRRLGPAPAAPLPILSQRRHYLPSARFLRASPRWNRRSYASRGQPGDDDAVPRPPQPGSTVRSTPPRTAPRPSGDELSAGDESRATEG
ncbi:proline-rich receptor-like protein kinase PERK2 [Iris pallida]|uniref:Proline-rich receptor-like protein kinase PERK2 n=1 Tax=Iris pallida TaxID=29817 RepID=A0AAX6EX66_IRIPA|nr:proline-rich receptor-like protein kinase PERK2 [Iris pallida]